MADEPDDDTLILDQPIEGDEPEVEGQEQQAEAEAPDQGEDETVVSFGDDEAAPASGETAPDWVRDLRKKARDLERENADLRRRIAPAKVEPGPRPTLESCEYDDDRFAEAMEAWTKRKAEAETADAATRQEEEQRQSAWQAELRDYGVKRESLRVPDFQEAEDEVVTRLSDTQQALIVRGADNSAAVIYALGKRPDKLAVLSEIKDPVKFAFAVAKLEKDLKVTSKRKAPQPEEVVRGSAPISGGSDKHLERLEREAEKTGDRTKLIQYRRQREAKAMA